MKLAGFALLIALALPGTASAQTPAGAPEERIGRFAVDLQGSLANFPQDGSVASQLGIVESDLPSRGLGARLAGTFYPFRLGGVTIGVGGALAFAGASQTAATGEGTFNTEFFSIAPQLSLNFGRARGWSYLSAGVSRSRLTIAPEDAGDGPGAGTVDYGGGARWFAREHLAFSFDLRFYNVAGTPVEGDIPARGRTTMMVISAGISVK